MGKWLSRMKPIINHEEDDDGDFNMSSIIESFALETRRIYLFNQITQESANYVVAMLQLLSHSNDPIYMYIGSYGGDVCAGYSIIDQMGLCASKIYTIINGSAVSMGAIIACYGTKGCRFGTKNSIFMLHPFMVGHDMDNVQIHNRSAQFQNSDYLEKLKDIAKRMKVGYNKLKELTDLGHWMNTKEAIEFGLIDGIWTKEKELQINKDAKARIEKRNEDAKKNN